MFPVARPHLIFCHKLPYLHFLFWLFSKNQNQIAYFKVKKWKCFPEIWFLVWVIINSSAIEHWNLPRIALLSNNIKISLQCLNKSRDKKLKNNNNNKIKKNRNKKQKQNKQKQKTTAFRIQENNLFFLFNFGLISKYCMINVSGRYRWNIQWKSSFHPSLMIIVLVSIINLSKKGSIDRLFTTNVSLLFLIVQFQ